jgi:CubicO group peptidase (beta-lactamase class C family)
VERDTIFLVASITKPVTATAAMLLVERGKLTLDEPVVSFVPEFAGKGKEKVLVRHLLTHTSGLPDQLQENQELRAGHAPLKEFVQRICQVDLLFPPGTNVSYQSCGFAMIAEIVERIEGVEFRDFLRQDLFDPLGMDDTSLGAQWEKLPRISQVKIPAGDFQYGPGVADWNWNSPYWWNFRAPWGGMFSTVEDLTSYCQMFLEDGRHNGLQILSPAAVAAMTRDQIVTMVDIPARLKLTDRWGLGWRLARGQHSAFGDLVSPATFGHGGATGTLLWADPKLQLTCVVLTNDPAGADRLRRIFSTAVAGSVTDV